jgi:hypothetical protein
MVLRLWMGMRKFVLSAVQYTVFMLRYIKIVSIRRTQISQTPGFGITAVGCWMIGFAKVIQDPSTSLFQAGLVLKVFETIRGIIVGPHQENH